MNTMHPPRPPIRVFVADDHAMIRFGLAAMVQAERELLWVGDAANGSDALHRAPELQPDIVLMDLVMPQMDGITAIVALRPLLPDARFVALASLLEPQQVRRALDAGAVNVLLKSASEQELIAVIRATAAGQRILAPEVAEALATDERRGSPGHDLTARERELLGLMARGLSNQEISSTLAIAMPTVKFHVTNILAKMHADNRTEAVLTALKHKLVSLE